MPLGTHKGVGRDLSDIRILKPHLVKILHILMSVSAAKC